MASILHNSIYAFRRKGSTMFLAFSFFLGLVFGLFVFCCSGEPLYSMMRRCLFSSVSIVGFLSGATLPFLLSALAVFFSKPCLTYLISFVEAFLFCYVSLLIIFVFQPAGFFVRFLLLFGDFLSLPVLYFFWHRSLSENPIKDFSGIFLFLSTGCLIGCFDYCLISPFSTDLIFFLERVIRCADSCWT